MSLRLSGKENSRALLLLLSSSLSLFWLCHFRFFFPFFLSLLASHPFLLAFLHGCCLPHRCQQLVHRNCTPRRTEFAGERGTETTIIVLQRRRSRPLSLSGWPPAPFPRRGLVLRPSRRRLLDSLCLSAHSLIEMRHRCGGSAPRRSRRRRQSRRPTRRCSVFGRSHRRAALPRPRARQSCSGPARLPLSSVAATAQGGGATAERTRELFLLLRRLHRRLPTTPLLLCRLLPRPPPLRRQQTSSAPRSPRSTCSSKKEEAATARRPPRPQW